MRPSKDIIIIIHVKLILLASCWFSGDFGALVEAPYLVFVSQEEEKYALDRRDYLFIKLDESVFVLYLFF